MDHGGLSLREVEQRMRCSTRVVKALVDHGHLPSRIAANPVNRGLQRIVLPADLEGFLERFIPLHSLAAERGIHFIILKDSLEKAAVRPARSEEHTSELQSLMRISYAVFCLKKKKQ